MQEYYAKRALEYEDIYHRQDQERQAEQTLISQALQRSLAGRTTLEVACGTGYWTQFLSETATRIVAFMEREGIRNLGELVGVEAHTYK